MPEKDTIIPMMKYIQYRVQVYVQHYSRPTILPSPHLTSYVWDVGDVGTHYTPIPGVETRETFST